MSDTMNMSSTGSIPKEEETCFTARASTTRPPNESATAAAAEVNAEQETTDFSNQSLDDDLSPYADTPAVSPTSKKTAAHPSDLSGLCGVDTASLEVQQATGVRSCMQSHPCLSRLDRLVATVVPRGGLISNVYTLASATLGAGIVTVPSGFHASGIVVSAVLLLVVCACTIYSLRLLAMTTNKTGLRSYEEMARGLLGRGWDYFTAFLLFVFCWGTCIGYVISVGDLLTPMLDAPGTSPFLQTPSGKRVLIGLVWLVGMFTLSLPKEINSLRYASVVGVSFIVFFVVCVVIHSATNGMRDGLRSNVNLATSGMEAVNGLTLFIFAFLNQMNFPEVMAEAARPTTRILTRDASVAMGLVALLNFLSGFFGYLDFGEGVTGSILLLYRPRENALFMVAYVGVCVKVCVGFAICVQPARDAIYYCLGWGKTSDVKYWVNWIVSTLVALSALILGMFVPNITIVFSLLGGICGGFLGFILPAYFYIYSGGFSMAKVGIYNFIGCVILIVGGVVAVVFGTAAAIYSEIQG